MGRRMTNRLGVSAVIMATAILGFPAQAQAAYFAYAGWDGPNVESITGVDGYIRSSQTATVASGKHRAEWLNLCTRSCGGWVQIGQYQGGISSISSSSVVHVYTENAYNYAGGSTCYYTVHDWGARANANEAYYIYSLSSSVTYPSSCGGYESKFAFKKGSYTSPFLDAGFMTNKAGQVMVQTELAANSLPHAPNNTDYYGTNNSQQPSAAHSIKIQKAVGASFVDWTPSSLPNSKYRSSGPPTLHTTRSYWSFITD
jgi:hypothetical protein